MKKARTVIQEDVTAAKKAANRVLNGLVTKTRRVSAAFSMLERLDAKSDPWTDDDVKEFDAAVLIINAKENQ